MALPHKLPPRREALPVKALPMLGFLEQTVASQIIKASTAVGNFKPKYPFLTPSKSALIYVAYHLKGATSSCRVKIYVNTGVSFLRGCCISISVQKAWSTRFDELFVTVSAYNPKKPEYIREKYKRKLAQFEETCELIRYLGDNMGKKYKEPQERPIDFDSKMQRFMKLKSTNSGITTWVS